MCLTSSILIWKFALIKHCKFYSLGLVGSKFLFKNVFRKEEMGGKSRIKKSKHNGAEYIDFLVSIALSFHFICKCLIYIDVAVVVMPVGGDWRLFDSYKRSIGSFMRITHIFSLWVKMEIRISYRMVNLNIIHRSHFIMVCFVVDFYLFTLVFS